MVQVARYLVLLSDTFCYVNRFDPVLSICFHPFVKSIPQAISHSPIHCNRGPSHRNYFQGIKHVPG